MSITKRRKEGKVITTFDYAEDGHFVKFELRLIKKANDRLVYQVDHDEPKIKMEHADAETLRQLVRTEAKNLLTITWKKVLVIHVNRDQQDTELHYTACEASLGFSVEFWEFGVTSTGREISRKMSADGGHYRQEWEWPYRLGKGQRSRIFEEAHEGTSYIDWTDESLAKVMSIQQGLTRLSESLLQLMRQDQVMTTLTNVRVLGLPAPEPRKGKR